MACNRAAKNEIEERIEKDYYALNFNLDSVRDDYRFDESCQGTDPQAIAAFWGKILIDNNKKSL